MQNLVLDTQMRLLAQTLGTTPETIDTLQRLGPEEIRALQRLTSAYLFDELGPIFGRVSALAPLVPDALVAKVAELAVPPIVAGRAAGALGVAHPHRINAILRRLSPEYMAASAAAIDPRVIPLISAGLDIHLLIPAARILLAHSDFTTVALLASSIDNDQLVTDLLTAINDDGGDLGPVLQALAYAPTDTWINKVLRGLPRALLGDLFTTSTDTEILVALAIITRLDTDLRSNIAEHIFDHLRPGGAYSLAATARANGAHAELKVFTEALGTDRREQFERAGTQR